MVDAPFGLTRRRLRRYLVGALAAVVGVAVVASGVAVQAHLNDVVANLLAAILVEVITLAVALLAGAIAAAAVWVHFRPDPDAIEIDCSGVLLRDPPPGRGVCDVEAAIEAIEDCPSDAEEAGLVVHLDSPGGPVGPSEDLAAAVDAFDGPTVAVAGDTCASGGYMVAAACDRVLVRPYSLVGSIGVTGSRPIAAGLRDRLDVDWLELSAGKFKEAGHPLRHVDADEQEYLASRVERYYSRFVDHVAAHRDLTERDVADTDAKVFVGATAVDTGLADAVGDEDDGREWLSGQLGTDVDDLRTKQVAASPSHVPFSARAMAFAFGRGIAAGLDLDATRRAAVQFAYRWR